MVVVKISELVVMVSPDQYGWQTDHGLYPCEILCVFTDDEGNTMAVIKKGEE